MSEVIRKLASIQKVLAVTPIEGADSICSYTILGWNIVDSIGKYSVGDLVVYYEIDSWIPTTVAAFLSKGKDPRVYQGIQGEKLRTIKLRKTVSQGLIMPLSPTCDHIESELFEGLDVTFPLGIVKWEPVLPSCLVGQAKGLFPSFGRKTDQERCCDAGTVLETSEGLKTIKDICDSKFSGLVKAYNHTSGCVEMSPVTNWIVSPAIEDKWLRIKTKSGREIIVTANHKLFNPVTGEYQEASSFKVGVVLAIN